jgi:hypothetical protein
MLTRGSPACYRSSRSDCPLSGKRCGSDAGPEPSARLEVRWDTNEDGIGAHSETHTRLRRGPCLGN